MRWHWCLVTMMTEKNRVEFTGYCDFPSVQSMVWFQVLPLPCSSGSLSALSVKWVCASHRTSEHHGQGPFLSLSCMQSLNAECFFQTSRPSLPGCPRPWEVVTRSS